MGWVGLFQLPLLLMYGYRIHLLIRHPTTLDAFVRTRWHAALRKLGIGLMLVGTLAAFGMAFSGQLAQLIFGTKGPNGIAAFVVALWFAMASGAGVFGVICFEISRLLGFEDMLRPPRSR